MLTGDVRDAVIEVRVVDNHPAMLRGIGLLVEDDDQLALAGLHAHVSEIVEQTADAHTAEGAGLAGQVVVLDLFLGRDDELSTPWIPGLVQAGAIVLLHTSVESPAPLRAAVSAGAAGLSLKADGLEALREAVIEVARGEFACSSELAQALLHDPRLVATLSARELDVIRALDDGLTQPQIAGRLYIAPSTVKDHLKAVRRKYLDLGREITNSHSIVREARRDGWL